MKRHSLPTADNPGSSNLCCFPKCNDQLLGENTCSLKTGKNSSPEAPVTPYIEHLCLLHRLGSDLRVPRAHTLPGLSALGGRSLRRGHCVQRGNSYRFPGSSFLPFDTERNPTRCPTGPSQTMNLGGDSEHDR